MLLILLAAESDTWVYADDLLRSVWVHKDIHIHVLSEREAG